MTSPNNLEIRMLGDLEVRSSGSVLSMPQSKKTRALLGYLVLTGRSQRRERLCALFWDVADDPRGALRWSLSKIRAVLGQAHAGRVVSERDAVRFDPDGAWVDVLSAREAVSSGLDALSTDELTELSRVHRGELLEGLDLSDFHEYQSWCTAQREQSRREHAAVLRALVERLGDRPEAALPFARELSQVDALEEEAHATLLRLLLAAGRDVEAEQYRDSARRMLATLSGRSSGALDAIWRDRASLAAPARATDEPPAPAVQPKMELDEAPLSRAYLQAPLVGRSDALERFAATVAAGRRGRAFLMTGEPGVGKSRLIQAFFDAARSRAARVLTGRAFETESAHPYAIWLDAFRHMPPGSATIAAELIELLSRAPRDDRTSREELYKAVAQRIDQYVGDAAILSILFDDMQWCDEASTELLHYVLRFGRNEGSVVVLAARSGELSDNAAASRLVRTLRRERVLDEMELEPLSREATVELVRQFVSDSDADALFERCAGNPLYALELARSRERDVTGALPESLAALVRERVERLEPGPADVLRWAAVIGKRFDPRRLETLASLAMVQLIDHLAMLERYQFLVAESGGGYAFAHDLVRAVVYADLSEPRRRLMHLCAARALEPLARSDELQAQDFAHHAGLSGDPMLAASACVRAAKHSLRLFANGEAAAMARRGRVHAEALGERERVPVVIELLQVTYRARRPERRDVAAAELEALGARALELGELVPARRAFHLVSHLRWESGSWADAERYSREAERVSRSADERERVLALAEAGRCLTMLERDLSQADAMLIEAQVLCRRLGQEPGALTDAVGLLRLQEGRLEEAESLFRRARATAIADRNSMEEFQALEHLVLVELARGRHADVSALADELTVLAERLREGSELPFARALSALGSYASQAREHTAALDDALAGLREADAKHRLALTLTRAACLDLDAGRFALAEQRAAEALDAARALDRPSEVALALGIMARAGEALGDHDRALSAQQQLDAHDLKYVSAEVRAWLGVSAPPETSKETAWPA